MSVSYDDLKLGPVNVNVKLFKAEEALQELIRQQLITPHDAAIFLQLIKRADEAKVTTAAAEVTSPVGKQIAQAIMNASRVAHTFSPDGNKKLDLTKVAVATASGAASGAVSGAAGGPGGAVVGAVIGAVVGALSSVASQLID